MGSALVVVSTGSCVVDSEVVPSVGPGASFVVSPPPVVVGSTPVVASTSVVVSKDM